MLTSIKHRLGHDDEQGFTLIELMVVVLIIAILLAIAIPTFLGARNSANSRAAQSNLRNSVTAEQTVWTNNQAFSATLATLRGAEPSLGWTVTTPETSAFPANSVLVTIDGSATPGSQWVELTALGKDNNCYSIAQVNIPFISGAVTVPAGTYYAQLPAPAAGCAAPVAPSTAAGPGTSTAHSAPTNAWEQAF